MTRRCSFHDACEMPATYWVGIYRWACAEHAETYLRADLAAYRAGLEADHAPPPIETSATTGEPPPHPDWLFQLRTKAGPTSRELLDHRMGVRSTAPGGYDPDDDPIAYDPVESLNAAR